MRAPNRQKSAASSPPSGPRVRPRAEIFLKVPYLLCIWHVNNDVEAYCRKLWKVKIDSIKLHTTAEERSQFVENEWNGFRPLWRALIYAKTEAEYEQSWNTLTEIYWLEYPEILSYLADTWLSHKEKTCMAWPNKITHFGNSTT
jgi:hypothetical protein